MTPNYEDRPTGPPKKSGIPIWGWVLIGCGVAPLPIIAILAAILFPVFAQAREKARQISCLSNIKQQSLGILMYAQDYDEQLPPKNAKWMDLAASNIKNEKVFHCPSLKGGVGYGYAMNPEPLGKKIAKIANPETVSLIFDAESGLTKNAFADPKAGLAYRHARKMANVAYLDGHAKGVTRGQ
jgi:prepilin-type processing-associated H-X9-DG protein